MVTLQIYDQPDPLYYLLELRARRSYPSLSLQFLVNVQEACGGDPLERYRQALVELAALPEAVPLTSVKRAFMDLIN